MAGRPRALTPVLLADAITRYQAGETVCVIADSLGVSSSTLNRGLRDAGVAMRGVGRPRWDAYEQDLEFKGHWVPRGGIQHPVPA